MHQRIDVETPYQVARAGRRGGGAEIRPHLVPLLDPAKRERERPAAVGERETQLGQTIQDTTEYHRADRQRRLGGHADEPRQPVLSHAVLPQHFPGVHEDRRVKRLCRLEDLEDRSVIEVGAVDVAADLDARQVQLLHATLQLLHGERGILHRNGPQPDETVGELGAHTGDVIVENARKVQRIGGLRAVAEHDRDGREHLHVHTGPVTVGQTHGGVPQVRLDVPEELVVDHHAGAALTGVFEPHPAAGAVALAKIGPLPGKDVGVQVDLHSRSMTISGSKMMRLIGVGLPLGVPHFLHVFSSMSAQNSSIDRAKCSTMSAQSNSLS